jgi:ABC-type branched-subunit amino acid transport system substrate-binding protein
MMNHKWKIAMACFMVVALLATLSYGCAEKEKDGKVTITIGHITDMSGPASPAYRAVTFALEDVVRYFNEEDLIPGVKIEIVTYDTGYNPARDIPGYDWCRDRGAKVIYGALPSAGVLKPFAQGDEIPVVTLAVSKPMIEPPGWLFAMNAPVSYQIKAFLKWISEEDWDYDQGIPKIGSVGWEEPYHLEVTTAIKEYVDDHPGQFDYVAGLLAPYGSVSWAGEVVKLRGCDYVYLPSTGLDTLTFAREFRNKGGTATFIGVDAMDAFRGLLLDGLGWEDLDGSIAAHAATRWWGETSPIVDLAEQLLSEYHPGEAADIVHAGIGYIGGFHQAYGFLELLQETIDDVGAENFDGQAFYDTAIGFSKTWVGYEQWGFTETKRYAWDYVGIYEWSQADGDVVRFVTDWLPNLIE